jgi:hypothetical protein
MHKPKRRPRVRRPNCPRIWPRRINTLPTDVDARALDGTERALACGVAQSSDGAEAGNAGARPGCGNAVSSIFLAKEFGVQVWTTDLWIGASENWARVCEAGVEERVFPVHAEAHTLPFAQHSDRTARALRADAAWRSTAARSGRDGSRRLTDRRCGRAQHGIASAIRIT